MIIIKGERGHPIRLGFPLSPLDPRSLSRLPKGFPLWNPQHSFCLRKTRSLSCSRCLYQSGIFRLPSSYSFPYARPTKWAKTPILCQHDLFIRKPHQTGRAAVKLDLQPFMPLPPSQVFAQAVAIFICMT